jgi:hypothetical protein
MELSGTLMVTALERASAFPNFGFREPSDEGVVFWDITDAVNPRRLGQFRTGGNGTHRNFYSGGRYAHLAAGMKGYDGNIYVIVDVSDPARPQEAGRWWVPGQHIAGGEKPLEPHISLHGPPYVVNSRAYLPYGSAGLVILDIKEVARPRQLGQLDFSPPFHRHLGMHGVLPVEEKGLAYVNSEDISYGKGPLHHASIVDISNPAEPKLISILPRPLPPPDAPYRDFNEKGGWAGPHNMNQLQHNRDVQRQGDFLYLTWFNAGLRVFDVSNPRQPKEVAHFLPPEPTKRFGPMPQGKLVLQTEDVLVDRRGYIYLTDKNQGLWILRLKPALVRQQ